jgi:ergothioneine biosynthesis protein EgtB
MRALIERAAGDGELEFLVTLGLHHEQQHQELILTDIKHMFSLNPLMPALRETPRPPPSQVSGFEYLSMPGGVVEIGHYGGGFAFDNETPRHRSLLVPHALASRPVTNAEYLEFIRDGGYTQPALWLSDGWAKLNAEGWTHPLYWTQELDAHYTLGGLRELDPHAPVCHVSYYEADAYARWAQARLPTEAELEHAASPQPIAGNFVESGYWQPVAAPSSALTQLYGDVWEWTSSAYSPYPGFKPLRGSLGEYNGKFMCSQLVLRGGSCATPVSHMRASYRNFFYPDARWQYTGIRLAKDQ